jgi:endonuclease YncB( thermonuclease family)
MRAFILATLLILFAANSASAEQIRGRVVGVSDGDTVTLLTDEKLQYKIRLTGIDAPEKTQAFGQASKRHLSQMIYGQTVTADCIGTDRYKRNLCKIIIGGKDANLSQIEGGYAWHYKKYQSSQSPADRLKYSDAETAARENSKGLLSESSPIPPWDYRRGGGGSQRRDALNRH